jgi:hypothetical protein
MWQSFLCFLSSAGACLEAIIYVDNGLGGEIQRWAEKLHSNKNCCLDRSNKGRNHMTKQACV